MDTARDKRTLDFVEAEELWTMGFVDNEGYICWGCVTQVYPASYDKERNKKRPYFSLGPVNKHQHGCDVDGEEKVIKRARKERVGTADGFPLPFPNRLTLTDERTVVPVADSQAAGKVRGGSGLAQAPGVAGNKHHGHTVKTIRPACSTFIKFPFDRKALPLAIPGISGKTYAKIFRYLGSRRPENFADAPYLYYAAIRWKSAPVVTETSCELTLNAGEWDDSNKRYLKLSRVRVDWSHWSKSRRDSLMREFEATREEAAEEASSGGLKKGWLFFIGTQDADDPGLFHVSDHRLICCLTANMIWPGSER